MTRPRDALWIAGAPAAPDPWAREHAGEPWREPWRLLGRGRVAVTVDRESFVVDADLIADVSASLAAEVVAGAGLVPWTLGADWGGRRLVAAPAVAVAIGDAGESAERVAAGFPWLRVTFAGGIGDSVTVRGVSHFPRYAGLRRDW
jgi:hypothetical protein